MGAGAIKHSGEVIRVEKSVVYVKMTVGSACASCHARTVCGAGESAEKVVAVHTATAADYQVGDSVEVALQQRSMGIKSVVLAYVVPLIVLCAVLLGAVAAGVDQGLAALLSLVGVACYYAVLYLLRGRMENTIKFIITKQTK